MADTEIKISIQGVEELQKGIAEMTGKLSYETVSETLLEGARVVAKVAKSKVGKKTGNLRNAIIAKSLPERFGRFRDFPVAIVTVQRERKGHHVHLVEKGTVERETSQGASRGKMPAKPFLEPSWDETKQMVLMQVMNDLKNKIEVR